MEGFSQPRAVPETTYAIAFKPDSDAPPGQYHKLNVRLTARNGDYVQARPGYLTLPPPAKPKMEIRPIDQQATRSALIADHPCGSGIAEFTFIGALLDPSGKLVFAKEGEMNLALKRETLDRLKASGVNANLSLSASW